MLACDWSDRSCAVHPPATVHPERPWDGNDLCKFTIHQRPERFSQTNIPRSCIVTVSLKCIFVANSTTARVERKTLTFVQSTSIARPVAKKHSHHAAEDHPAATWARAVPITTVFEILFGPKTGVFSLYSANSRSGRLHL